MPLSPDLEPKFPFKDILLWLPKAKYSPEHWDRKLPSRELNLTDDEIYCIVAGLQAFYKSKPEYIAWKPVGFEIERNKEHLITPIMTEVMIMEQEKTSVAKSVSVSPQTLDERQAS